MTKFAAKTTTTVAKSKADIEATLERYGADQFITGWKDNEAVIAFRMQNRHVKFRLPLPAKDDEEITHYRHSTSGNLVERASSTAEKMYEQACRSRWRALLLVIKAKLEAVETGITIFDDEFLAHIVMPDGLTVAEHVQPSIERAYETGNMPPLIPHFGGGQ